MKNKRKQMLLSSAIMLVVAVLALTSTTFAWFTTTNQATIDNVQMTAKSAGGIDMCFDGGASGTWYSTLTTDKFNAATNGTVGTGYTASITGHSAAAPVSGGSSVADGKLSFFSGTVDGEKITMAAAAAADFYVFNIYVRNTDPTTAVSLKLDTTTGDKSKVIHGTSDKGTENAVRVAFIDQGNVSAVGTNEAVAAAATVLIGGTTATVWNPNKAQHVDYAVSTGRIAAADTPEALTYNAVSGAGDLSYVNGLAVKNGSDSGATSSITCVDGTTDIGIASIPANSVEKITVYVWIEGQDVDCNNAQALGDIVTNLRFTK